MNRSKFEVARQALADLRATYTHFLTSAQAAYEAIGAAGLDTSPAQIENHLARRIIEIVAAEYGLSLAVILSPLRTETVVEARHAAMVLLRRNSIITVKAIGEIFRRDHGTVCHAEKKVSDRLANELAFAARFARLQSLIKSAA